MNRKLRNLGAAMVVSVATVLPSMSAHADAINIFGWWGGNRWDASMTLSSGLVNYHDGSVIGSTQSSGPFGAGGFNTINNTTGDSFLSWCVDVFHDFYFNSSTSHGTAVLTSAASVFGAARAADLGRLATEAYPLVGGHGSTADNSAAFQLAVWEIVNENGSGGYNLSAGNFRASAGGNSATIAQGWLNNLPATSGYNADIWMMQGNGARGWGPQDVVVFTTAVPEPETYALMLAGLGIMGFVARRRGRGQTA